MQDLRHLMMGLHLDNFILKSNVNVFMDFTNPKVIALRLSLQAKLNQAESPSHQHRHTFKMLYLI